MTEATQADAAEAVPETKTAPVEQDAKIDSTETPADTNEPDPTEEAATSEAVPGEDSAAEGKPKKHKGGFQKRIDELTVAKSEEAKKRYEAELRAQQFQRELEAERKKSSPDLSGEPGLEPKLEEFTTVDDFKRAYADWARKDGAQQERKKTEQQRNQEREFSARAALATREDQARRKHADYDATVAPIGPLLVGNPTLAQYALTSEMAPEVGYHLGKNPSALLDILKMDPLNAIRELTKIETRLSAAPPPKPLTKAPNPIEPVGASEKAPFSLETASMQDFVKRRNEEERKSRKG